MSPEVAIGALGKIQVSSDYTAGQLSQLLIVLFYAMLVSGINFIENLVQGIRVKPLCAYRYSKWWTVIFRLCRVSIRVGNW